MTTKIVIIGSHSFSGNSYAAHVLKNEACLTVSRSPRLSSQFDARLDGNFSDEKIVWNVNDDSSEVIKAIQRNKVNTVVNFAAQSMVGQSWNYPEDWYQANVESLAKFVNRLRNETEVERFIHFTTPEVYGSTQGWVTEDCAYNPSTPYAVSRAAGDMCLKTYIQQYKFPAVMTRAANVYGPAQQLYRIIPRTILAAMTGQKLRLDGGGTSVRVFIHMQDVSDATLRIALNGQVGETYHISGYQLLSIRNAVETILASLNKEFDECVEITPERPGKDTAYTLDSLKLRTSLGWQDKVSFNDGINQTVEWMRKFEMDLPHLPCSYQHKA